MCSSPPRYTQCTQTLANFYYDLLIQSLFPLVFLYCVVCVRTTHPLALRRVEMKQGDRSTWILLYVGSYYEREYNVLDY